LDLLNQGESVHRLERPIHTGSIGSKRGRTTEQLAAMSGALSLLATIMAWNTQHIQVVAQQMPDRFPDELLGQIAPIAHDHINMRGIFTLALGVHRRTCSAANKHPQRERRRRNRDKRRVELNQCGSPVIQEFFPAKSVTCPSSPSARR
jgi:hypothetical protein